MAILKQKVFEVLEAGIYAAVVAAVEVVAGQFGEQLRFTFATLDPPHVEIFAWATATFSAKSKLFKWTAALFGGAAIPAGWDLDTDKLVGRKCRLMLTVHTAEDGSTYNKVADVLPWKVIASGSTVAPAAAPAPQPAPDNAPWADDEPPFGDEGLPF